MRSLSWLVYQTVKHKDTSCRFAPLVVKSSTLKGRGLVHWIERKMQNFIFLWSQVSLGEMHWHASEECFRWHFKAKQVLSASMFTPYSWTTYLLNSKHLCKAKTFRFCDYPHNVWITSSCCLHYARVIISPAECHAANSTQEIEWCEGVLWFTAIYACPDYTSEKIFISAITMTSKMPRCGVCDKSLLGGKMSKRGDTLLCRFIFWQDADDGDKEKIMMITPAHSPTVSIFSPDNMWWWWIWSQSWKQ